MTKFGALAGGAVAVGVIWLFVAGTVWQFAPIGAAILVGRLAAKALDRTGSAEKGAEQK